MSTGFVYKIRVLNIEYRILSLLRQPYKKENHGGTESTEILRALLISTIDFMTIRVLCLFVEKRLLGVASILNIEHLKSNTEP